MTEKMKGLISAFATRASEKYIKNKKKTDPSSLKLDELGGLVSIDVMLAQHLIGDIDLQGEEVEWYILCVKDEIERILREKNEKKKKKK